MHTPLPEDRSPVAEPPFEGEQWRTTIAQALAPERAHLLGLLRAVERARARQQPYDRNLARLIRETERSVARRTERLTQKPDVTFAGDLPIHARLSDIATAIREQQVVILCGETGSGKSTQLPKLCLDIGRGIDGLIGHTQPRRIAARTVAARIAQELGRPLGKDIGYQVRFADVTSPGTYIKLMTDGVLLAEIRQDRLLRKYDTLILDEAHERSLNIDFLIGYLKRLLPERPDLRLIVTSATIDAERFRDHFNAGPILQVSGRSYPVEIRYRPLELDDERHEPDPFTAIADAIDEVLAEGPGDVLVFLPTERDIHEAMKVLRGRLQLTRTRNASLELLPLYARLSVQEQQRVFETSGTRRVVLATNVAESSLTVPGIHYVIDSGVARISRYSPRSKLQRLPIEPISQASANQRAGRCGRIAPGVCIRLYAAEDFSQREAFALPEIQRTNLAAAILQSEALGLGSLEALPLLDPPKPEAIRDGYKTLVELQAVGEDRRLTDLGRQLSRIPVDPRVARMILAAHHEHCLSEVLIIAAALEVQDARERPLDKQADADLSHSRFLEPESDFLSYLKLWDFYHDLRQKLSRNQLRRACQQNFISYLRMREWIDVHHELEIMVEREGLKQGPRHQDYRAIHRALLTGLLTNIALKLDTGEYQVAGGMTVSLWPGSSLAGKKPKWIVGAELVETSRRFLRTTARIDPIWVEQLAPHLIHRHVSEPFWDPEPAAAMAWEKVSLLGLPIVPRRRVRFASSNSVGARRMLIVNGLVHGEWTTPPEFLVKNLALMAEMHDLAVRARRPQLLKDEDAIIAFYEPQLPETVNDGYRLTEWFKRLDKPSRERLTLTRAHLLNEDVAQTERDFPKTLRVRDVDLPLSYQLEPGSPRDGMTLTIPQVLLNQLDPERLRWLAPGLLAEKVAELIRTLPKDLRRQFVPIPEVAAEILAKLTFAEGRLLDQIAAELSQRCRQHIPATALEESRLPLHLRMNIAIEGENQQLLDEGRDLAALQAQWGRSASQSFESSTIDSPWVKTGLTSWSCGALPPTVDIQRQGVKMHGYPALVDRQQSVDVQLFDRADAAEVSMHRGVRRLIVFARRKELKQQIDWLPHINRWEQIAPSFPQPLALRPDLVDLLAERAYLWQQPIPRDALAFDQLLAAGRQRIPASISELTPLVRDMFDRYRELRHTAERLAASPWKLAAQDLQIQLQELFVPGFLTSTPWQWLSEYPRYLSAALARVKKIQSGHAQRDAQNIQLYHTWWRKFIETRREQRTRQSDNSELILLRWMFEEWRVALYAQEYGARVTVSEKRIQKQWEKAAGH